jgi:hypothetical protein
MKKNIQLFLSALWGVAASSTPLVRIALTVKPGAEDRPCPSGKEGGVFDEPNRGPPGLAQKGRALEASLVRWFFGIGGWFVVLQTKLDKALLAIFKAVQRHFLKTITHST